MRRLSIYIHIPFCVKKCRYCDFLSFAASEEKKTQYVQALLKEIETEAVNYTNHVVDTVFIGGGTPSVLPKGAIESIVACLKRVFAFTRQPEITMEVNPGTVDEEQLVNYKKAGINRLSIGTQSVQDDELAYLGRIHRAKDFFRTFEHARSAGFENINVDVMAALPGQSVETYMDNLRQILSLEPEHISAYSLIIEEGTDFYNLYGEEGKKSADVLPLPSEDEERKMYECTERLLAEAGYERYEISNYARAGRECRHNIVYWKRGDYAGFGIGAASMIKNVRWKNLSDMEEYIHRMQKGAENVKVDIAALSEAEQMEEFMFLGLRLTEGVSRIAFKETFGKEIEEVYGEILLQLEKKQLLENGEHIRLTPYGRDISNYVMAEFLLE